jgi:CRP-like cAMP-binding protein
MNDARWAAPLRRAVEMLGGDERDAAVREAAWVARCVGRGDSAPLSAGDISALAGSLQTRHVPDGQVLFAAGDGTPGVWIVRHGQVELAVGAGRRRVVVGVLHPGDVDGDIQVLLEMPSPYTARALGELTCLHLDDEEFDRLLVSRAAISRRWLSSVAQRLVASQMRIMNLLGKILPQQAAALLIDEAHDGQLRLPQRTLAAMLGVQRPSLNKVLKNFERRGLVAISYATIDLLDPRTLAEIADQR